VLLGARIGNALSLRRFPVALRSQPSLPQPLVPGAGAVALLAQPRPFAKVLLEQAFVPQRLRQHRRSPVDGGLPVLQQANQNLALLSREPSELEADAVPALDALVQIDLQVDSACSSPAGRRDDAGCGRIWSFGVPSCSRGPRARATAWSSAPAASCQWRRSGPQAVGRLRLAQTAVEPGGLDRRLDHQAVEDAPPRTGSARSASPSPDQLPRPQAKLILSERKASVQGPIWFVPGSLQEGEDLRAFVCVQVRLLSPRSCDRG